MKQRGFTLLEMLVATLIMAIAVVGLMGAINNSLRNATRIVSRDRAVLLARSKMDELLLDPHFPIGVPVQGNFDRSLTGGVAGGWRARMTRFEMPPHPVTGDQALDRLELEIWWMAGGERRTFVLNAYRADVLRSEDLQP
ncbi:MAG TPA: prepilin-type N-terminal cleavage/methylation domain-containing protein [Bryobacteraceae bacterium]|nr:prepilin-type N-terminal cleavage/methylation domain-containing protein [Bryobacteraceae bacterium]